MGILYERRRKLGAEKEGKGRGERKCKEAKVK